MWYPFLIYIIIGFAIAILRKYIVKHAPKSARMGEPEEKLEQYMEKEYIELFVITIVTLFWLPLILVVIVRKKRD